MSLASLTIDLVMNLAKFEGDSGKAAQIVARDSQKMERAQVAFLRSLERTAERVGKSQAEFLTLKAAQLGVAESAQKYIDVIAAGGNAVQRVATQSTAGFNAMADAATRSVERQKGGFQDLVNSISAVSAAAAKRRAELIADQEAGRITPEKLKSSLSQLGSQRDEAVARLKAYAEQEAATRQLADAEQQAVAQRRAALATLTSSLAGVSQAYQKNLEVLRASLKAGDISPADFVRRFRELNEQQNPNLDRFRAQQVAAEKAARQQEELNQRIAAEHVQRVQKEIEAERKLADEEAALIAKRRANYASLVDTLNGIPAAYRRNLQVLQDALKSGDITPKEFASRLSSLNEQQNPNVIRYRQEQQAAKEAAEARDASARRAAAAEAASANSFIATLQSQVDAIGKTRAELLALEAAKRGVSQQAAPLIARLAEADKNMNKFGRQTGITRYELLTLQYTVSDVVASLASGISPMTILLQQGGQVRDVFGSFGNAFRAVGQLLTVGRVAFGAGAVAAGGFVAALYQGAEASKQFADTQVLTNGALGLTEGQFNRMAKSIGESSRLSSSTAREFGQALAATGEVGPKNFRLATEAAARYGQATGQTAEEVAKSFAGMNQGAAKWAAETNKSFNFITAEQYKYIKTLEETGRAEEARGVVLDALNERLKGLDRNLGTIDRLLEGGKKLWKDWWDAALDVGRADTLEDKLRKTAQRVAERNRQLAQESRPANRAVLQEEVVREQDNARGLSRQAFREQENAYAQAELVLTEKRRIAAIDFIDKLREEAKGVELVTKKVAEAQRQFDALKGTPNEISAAEQERLLSEIRKKYTNQEVDQTRKARLSETLKLLESGLQAERDALSFHDQYLKGVYASFGISLKEYYDERRSAAERGLQEELSIYDREIAALRQYLAATSDPSERIGTQQKIEEAQAKATRARLQAARSVQLANQEEAQGYRDLGERVQEYRAQLLQLQGDEAGAAQIRARQTIENARRLAAQTGGAISPEEIARQERALEIANQYAEAQRRLGLVTTNSAREEELFKLRSERAGATLIEQEQGIAAIRREAAENLRVLAEEAQRYAAASTDPRIKAFADDLVLQYERAAQNIEPALNRLRDAGASLASSIASRVTDTEVSFKKLPQLINSIVQDINRAFVKVAITEPLEKQIAGFLRSVTEGGGAIGEAFKKILGIGGGEGAGAAAAAGATAATAAQTTQTTAVTASTAAILSMTSTGLIPGTAALTFLTQAANSAAIALTQVASAGGGEAGASALASLFNSVGGNSGPMGSYTDNPFQAIGLDTGTNYVPRDMLAKIHEGEAVVPKRYNPAAGGRAAGAPMRVAVAIENNGEPARVERAEAQQTDDGLLVNVMLTRVAQDIKDGGKVGSAVQQTYGLRRNLERRG